MNKIIDTDTARKIWLAGVGAYGRMAVETQGAMTKLAKNANEAFDQLVAKGEEVEDKVRDAIAKTPSVEKVSAMVGETSGKIAAFGADRRAALNARVEEVRKTVTEAVAPWNVAALTQAVEDLSAKIDTLTAEVTALKKAAKAPAAPKAKAPAAAPKAKKAA
jgi:polyhydroxyalkanoate synthesis regulator phasin